jgi:putative nucleotidyltransferase with HDIG domain
VVFGPLAAALLGALSMATLAKAPNLRWVIWTSNRTLLSGLAGLAAYEVRQFDLHPVFLVVMATAAAAFVNFSLDVVLNSVTLLLRNRGNVRELVFTAGSVAAAGVPLYTAVVGLLAYVYIYVTPWSAALFFVPALAAQRLFLLYREQQNASRRLVRVNAQLEEANLSFAAALVATLDARDRYTAGHSTAVAFYSNDIAIELGLSEEQQALAHLSGLVHDIGKIGLTAGLLEKPGPLNSEEREQMQEHSAIGERILQKVDGYAEIAQIVRHHHERLDGQGYPDGLTREQIPLISKIIAVADAYDAMTSDRPYRDAMSSNVARRELAKGVERQFDVEVVAAFESVLRKSGSSYLVRARDQVGADEWEEAQLASTKSVAV